MLIACGLPAGSAATAMTPTEALSYVRAGDVHFSPDGKRLAYVAISYRWDWQPHLRLLDLTTGKESELTPAGKSERSPQWSSDGQWLAFLSNRGGNTEVYGIRPEGGAPQALTASKSTVQSFHWSPDGQSIAYLAKDADAPAEDTGPQVADNEKSLARLWVTDIVAKTTRKLGYSGLDIDEFAWQDPTHILLVATDQPASCEFTDAVWRVSVRGGSPAVIARPPQPFATRGPAANLPSALRGWGGAAADSLSRND